MIVFPLHYVQLEVYPGYYWNYKTKKLYSCKSGVLKELTISTWNPYPKFTGLKWNEPHYNVSISGRRRKIALADLMVMKPPEKVQIFPEVKDAK
jgi:hypothetical protein